MEFLEDGYYYKAKRDTFTQLKADYYDLMMKDDENETSIRFSMIGLPNRIEVGAMLNYLIDTENDKIAEFYDSWVARNGSRDEFINLIEELRMIEERAKQ